MCVCVTRTARTYRARARYTADNVYYIATESSV